MSRKVLPEYWPTQGPTLVCVRARIQGCQRITLTSCSRQHTASDSQQLANQLTAPRSTDSRVLVKTKQLDGHKLISSADDRNPADSHLSNYVHRS